MEDRLIAPEWKLNPQPPVQPRGIGLGKPLAHFAASNPDDRDTLSIEIVVPFEHVDGEIPLFDRVAPSGEGLLDNITEKGLSSRAPGKCGTLQQLIQMRQNPQPFLLGVRQRTMEN